MHENVKAMITNLQSY